MSSSVVGYDKPILRTRIKFNSFCLFGGVKWLVNANTTTTLLLTLKTYFVSFCLLVSAPKPTHWCVQITYHRHVCVGIESEKFEWRKCGSIDPNSDVSWHIIWWKCLVPSHRGAYNNQIVKAFCHNSTFKPIDGWIVHCYFARWRIQQQKQKRMNKKLRFNAHIVRHQVRTAVCTM